MITKSVKTENITAVQWYRKSSEAKLKNKKQKTETKQKKREQNPCRKKYKIRYNNLSPIPVIAVNEGIGYIKKQIIQLYSL